MIDKTCLLSSACSSQGTDLSFLIEERKFIGPLCNYELSGMTIIDLSSYIGHFDISNVLGKGFG